MTKQVSISYTATNESSWWAVNNRDLSQKVVKKITDFLSKFKLAPFQGAKVIESIYLHPNQISLESFLDNCLAGTISFVFLGDRAGVGSKERARDVWSFDSLDEMVGYSQFIKHPSGQCGKISGKNKPRYSSNYNIRGKDGRFTKQSPMEIGTRIHEGWEKVFNAHTPPPIPSNYNYYNNLKRGTAEYNGSRQFVKNYVSQNAVSAKEAIKVFNQGVANFGKQFESLVKTCPNLVDNKKYLSHCIAIGNDLKVTKPYQFIFGDSMDDARSTIMTQAEYDVVSKLIQRSKPANQ